MGYSRPRRIEEQAMALFPQGLTHIDQRCANAGERAVLRQALARAGGNASEAARSLGIGRATLYRRLARVGLSN